MLVSGKLELSKPHDTDNNLFEARPFNDFEELASPRLLSSHLCRGLMPKSIFEQGNKVVVLMRNPRDTAVSMYRLYHGHPIMQYSGTWNGYYHLFVKGKGWFVLFIRDEPFNICWEGLRN